jgi:hypothetical protein
MKLSHVLALLAAGAAIVGFVVAIRAVGRSSADTADKLDVLVSSIPATAAAGAAAENVRAAIPALDAFFAESGSYGGLTTAKLRELDPGLGATVTVVWSRPDAVCIQSTVNAVTASATRPNGGVIAGSC